MNSNDASSSGGEPSGSIERKRVIGERLKRLQEKTGDLSETLDRIEKRLSEALGSPDQVNEGN
jgi:hypothetical protein